jgi:enoyl-CoA hydratase/carnithine racemase
MSYSELQYDARDGVAVVTLNRPDKLNAITPVIAAEMRAAMTVAAKDDAVRVIILTGAGRGFCAGADMTRLTGLSSGSDDRSLVTAKVDDMPFEAHADFKTRYGYFPAIPKPIIGAINGPCAGLGMVLALYCDVRIASEDVVFTTSFSRRGLIAEYGIAWTLPKLVGPSLAADLLLSARRVNATEALRIGLVSQVVPVGELLGAAQAYAKDLADNVSPRSMRVMKRQIWASMNQSLGEAVALAEEEMKGSFGTTDFKEGVAHFIEKRPARFTGR